MKPDSRSISLCALMTALTCIFSCIALPVGTVPFTLQTFAAALCGYVLRPKEAFFSILAYLILGACGLPVFSMLQGGIGMLAGSTGGFLMGLPVMAWLCACGRKNSIALQLLTGTAGLLSLYMMGAAYLSLTAKLTLRQALLVGVIPFIVKDVLSLAAAIFFAGRISRAALLKK